MNFKIIPGHEPIPSLIGLKRGEKNKYLRDNRLTILDYLDKNDVAATRSHYYIVNPRTWDNFKGMGKRFRPGEKLTRQELYEYHVNTLREDTRELKKDIHNVNERIDNLIPLLTDQLKEVLFNRLIDVIVTNDVKIQDRLINRGGGVD